MLVLCFKGKSLNLNWYFQTVVLEKTSAHPLDYMEVKPVNPKGNQPWLFIGRTDAEAPIFWPPDAKSWLIGKDPDAGKHWRQKEKGVTENEMVRQHYQSNGHEFQQTLGNSEGQRSLACYIQSMGLQRLGHDLVAENLWILKITSLKITSSSLLYHFVLFAVYILFLTSPSWGKNENFKLDTSVYSSWISYQPQCTLPIWTRRSTAGVTPNSGKSNHSARPQSMYLGLLSTQLELTEQTITKY